MQPIGSSRVLELEGGRIHQDSIGGFHGSNVTKLQESKVASFHVFKASNFIVKWFQGSRGKTFAGAFAGIPRKNSW